MKNTNTGMTQILIKTIVKRALKDIKESPERNTRNLVDMALNFSTGRFQKNFFEAAQKMLRNEQSAYYKLIQDIALTVDIDKIITFGMNVGYTSCTLGAQTIRRLEQEQQFNIPWSITLITDLQNNPDAIETYRSVIQQGKELGVYTWLIFSANKTQQLLPLMKENPDCGFVLFCNATELSESLLEEANFLQNLMFSIQYEENIANACAKLRQREMLYSLHIPYQTENAGLITSGGLLCCAEELQPIFTFFIPASDIFYRISPSVFCEAITLCCYICCIQKSLRC